MHNLKPQYKINTWLKWEFKSDPVNKVRGTVYRDKNFLNWFENMLIYAVKFGILKRVLTGLEFFGSSGGDACWPLVRMQVYHTWALASFSSTWGCHLVPTLRPQVNCVLCLLCILCVLCTHTWSHIVSVQTLPAVHSMIVHVVIHIVPVASIFLHLLL